MSVSTIRPLDVLELLVELERLAGDLGHELQRPEVELAIRNAPGSAIRVWAHTWSALESTRAAMRELTAATPFVDEGR